MRRRSLLLLGSGALYAGPLEDRIRRIEQRWASVASMATAVSIAVFRDGQIEWARAYGAATTTGTLFQAASISKPVAAMAALHMAQFGNFTLDPYLHFALLDGFVDIAHHRDPPDAEFAGDLVLGQALDIIHPCNAHPVAGNAAGTAVACRHLVLANRWLFQHRDPIPPAATGCK